MSPFDFAQGRLLQTSWQCLLVSRKVAVSDYRTEGSKTTNSGTDPFDFAQGRLRNVIQRLVRAGKQAHLCNARVQ